MKTFHLQWDLMKWKFVSQLHLEGMRFEEGGTGKLGINHSLINKLPPYYAVLSKNHVYQEVPIPK